MSLPHALWINKNWKNSAQFLVTVGKKGFQYWAGVLFGLVYLFIHSVTYVTLDTSQNCWKQLMAGLIFGWPCIIV